MVAAEDGRQEAGDGRRFEALLLRPALGSTEAQSAGECRTPCRDSRETGLEMDGKKLNNIKQLI